MTFQIAWLSLFSALGFLGGYWYCLRRSQTASSEAAVVWAREVLARVEELTTRVATDVGVHNTRVKRINDELVSSKAPDPAVVVTAVAKLVAVNDQIQQQLAEAESKLQEQSRAIETQVAEARTDALTGLPNRRALEHELTSRFTGFQRQGTPFAAILLDIDHFKKFNDLHGHAVGDEVLRGIADVLRRTTRGTDVAARYGGEEFVVVLSSASIDTRPPNRGTLSAGD